MEGVKIETGLLLHKIQIYISQKANNTGENTRKWTATFPKAEVP